MITRVLAALATPLLLLSSPTGVQAAPAKTVSVGDRVVLASCHRSQKLRVSTTVLQSRRVGTKTWVKVPGVEYSAVWAFGSSIVFGVGLYQLIH
jgi:hypothetical protein